MPSSDFSLGFYLQKWNSQNKSPYKSSKKDIMDGETLDMNNLVDYGLTRLEFIARPSSRM